MPTPSDRIVESLKQGEGEAMKVTETSFEPATVVNLGDIRENDLTQQENLFNVEGVAKVEALEEIQNPTFDTENLQLGAVTEETLPVESELPDSVADSVDELKPGDTVEVPISATDVKNPESLENNQYWSLLVYCFLDWANRVDPFDRGERNAYGTVEEDAKIPASVNMTLEGDNISDEVQTAAGIPYREHMCPCMGNDLGDGAIEDVFKVQAIWEFYAENRDKLDATFAVDE